MKRRWITRWSRRLVLVALVAAGAAAVALVVAWRALPFPTERLDRWPPSPVVTDAAGAPPLPHVLFRNLLLMLGLGPLVVSVLGLILLLFPAATIWETYLVINEFHQYAIFLFLLALALTVGERFLQPFKRLPGGGKT